MIFNLYQRVAVKIRDDEGDGERYIFDRSRLMFTEVAEIEKVTGLSYGEWERELGRYSITAVAALVHVLRKREGVPSNFLTMQFNAARLDVVPLHESGEEFTAEEIAKDLAARMSKAESGEDPTIAAAAAAVQAEQEAARSRPDTTITSLPSRGSTASARGNGTGSAGRTSASSRRTSAAAEAR